MIVPKVIPSIGQEWLIWVSGQYDFYGKPPSLHPMLKPAMAQLPEQDAFRNRKRPGVVRVRKNTLRIDMTPMVDLGFLLITFFVITAELSKPSVMNLAMPKDDAKNPNQLGESYALNILLGEKQHYYYFGSWENAFSEKRVQATSLTGLRQVIRERQQLLDDSIRYPEGRKGLMMLIKPSPLSDYNSLVDVLDEAIIHAVEKYAVIRISEEEKEWLRQRKALE